MPTFVKVKLKEFEEIQEISIPIPFLKEKEQEFVLQLKDDKYHKGLFFADLYQFCGKEIEVVDKADYEFANDYCLYYGEYKYRISDWMIDNKVDNEIKEIIMDKYKSKIFKDNDFVVVGKEIAIIKDGKVLFNDGMMCSYTEESKIELWQPKEGEYCWFNMEFEDGYENPILMQYGDQDYTMWDIEPFLNKLPIFLKGTRKINDKIVKVDENKSKEVIKPKENHCGVCIHFDQTKDNVYFCKLKHTHEEMFNYDRQIEENRTCEDIINRYD